ncbi:hypothetical protein KY284_004829 [Solanum tuberosum]|uniref:DNA binding protein n=1 Tax=Solanum tuberosum TaxID=4113 RepID=M1DJI5_SOLTU|nr:hypothetical protein KY284_004829 [Solanum tuberosum]
MGISGPKSRPDSVKGGFVDQNGLRGFVEGGVGIGTKTSPAQALEKIRGELRHVRREVQAEYGRILDFLEKGNDSLDFKLENYVSPGEQSTSQKCKEKKRKRVE